MAPEPSEWGEVQQELRAIVVVDIVESVRAMSQDEKGTVDRWRRFVHAARTEILPRYGGQMVKSLGDGMLLTFGSVRPALICAQEIQEKLIALLQDPGPGSGFMALRIGIHFADVVVDELDIYGVAVNLAARLTTLAGPGEIVASAQAVDEIVSGMDAEIEDLGECYLKHIEQPVRAYRVCAALCQSQGGRHFTSLPRDDGKRQDLPRPKVAVLTLEGAGSPLLRSLISDEIAARLSVHSTVDVISRMSTRDPRGIEPAAFVERLGATYALGGSCAVLNDVAIVWIELMFADDRRVVENWSLREKLGNLVAAPSSLFKDCCAGIMEAIEAHETGRARSMPLASLESYSLLIGGVRLMHRLSRADFERSHGALHALTARHPRHPEGYAWLAKWHILQTHQGWSADPAQSSAMARDMARRALDQDDHCGLAMVISGMVRMFNDRRLDDAEAILGGALDANPNDALAWLLKGIVHAFRGEGVEAVRHSQHACALSPLDPMRYYFNSLAASAEASAGNYERSIDLAENSLRSNVMHASTLRILTIAYAMLDRMPQARKMAQRIQLLEPGFTVGRFLERSPSADFPIGLTFADALARAGVPR